MADPPAPGTSRRATSPGTAGHVRRVVTIAMWIGAVLLLTESLFGERGFTAMVESRRQYEAVQASLDRLKAENAGLRSQARRLREDPTAIEEIARRDLRLLAHGEIVFIVKDARPAPTPRKPDQP